ncbi:MAG: hypothetical protein ABFC96_13135 [Thermoguttaceae bacterium]
MQRPRNHKEERRREDAQPIGRILGELLARYGMRVPNQDLSPLPTAATLGRRISSESQL